MTWTILGNVRLVLTRRSFHSFFVTWASAPHSSSNRQLARPWWTETKWSSRFVDELPTDWVNWTERLTPEVTCRSPKVAPLPTRLAYPIPHPGDSYCQGNPRHNTTTCCRAASVLPPWNSRCKIELIFGVMLQFNVVWCIHSRREIVLAIQSDNAKQGYKVGGKKYRRPKVVLSQRPLRTVLQRLDSETRGILSSQRGNSPSRSQLLPGNPIGITLLLRTISSCRVVFGSLLFLFLSTIKHRTFAVTLPNTTHSR